MVGKTNGSFFFRNFFEQDIFTGKNLKVGRKKALDSMLGLVTYITQYYIVSFSLVIARLLALRGNMMYVLLKRL
jgi:hypothetical protein